MDVDTDFFQYPSETALARIAEEYNDSMHSYIQDVDTDFFQYDLTVALYVHEAAMSAARSSDYWTPEAEAWAERNVIEIKNPTPSETALARLNERYSRGAG